MFVPLSKSEMIDVIGIIFVFCFFSPTKILNKISNQFKRYGAETFYSAL